MAYCSPRERYLIDGTLLDGKPSSQKGGGHCSLDAPLCVLLQRACVGAHPRAEVISTLSTAPDPNGHGGGQSPPSTPGWVDHRREEGNGQASNDQCRAKRT